MIQKLLSLILLVTLIACDNSSTSTSKQQKGPKNGLVHTYNSDGSISASIHYKDDIRHGLATDFYTDGKLRAKIDYVMGVKEGKAKWYHRNGNLFRITDYVADQRQGWQRKYYDDGELMSEVEFYEGFPGVGLKEYSQSGNERRAKTKFVLGESTKMPDGTTRVEVRLSNKVKEVSFYQGDLLNGKFMHEGLESINKTANMGYLVFPKGQNQVSVIAQYKTRYKNFRVVQEIVKK